MFSKTTKKFKTAGLTLTKSTILVNFSNFNTMLKSSNIPLGEHVKKQ